jgi:hypothetical protein
MQQIRWHKEGIHDSEEVDIMPHPAYVTNEYMPIYLSVTRIPRCFRWLTEKCTIYFSVLQLYSSVVTDNIFMVSYSAWSLHP